MKCRICGHTGDNRTFEVPEMMFGFRDIFSYFQCARCLCLQIAEFPSDLSKYYPDNYYSYEVNFSRDILRKLVTRLKVRYVLEGRGFLGKILYAMFPREDVYALRSLIRNKDISVLDVGCGAGDLLYALREFGMKNLAGVDPFNRADLTYENGLTVEKKQIHDVVGKWDLVMFQHSFEHMPDPGKTLETVSRLLTPEGCCVIRIPVVPSYAWEHYGVNWVQLDAPRHLFLHSVQSMTLLAERAGLHVDDVVYDSTAFQFLGSEQYVRGIPLRDKRSYFTNRHASVFSRKDVASYVRRARELNRAGTGDQAVFYLKHR